METIQELTEALAARNQSGAKSENSLSFKCLKCQDSGWVDEVDEQGRYFVKKCECRLAREAERRIEDSGLGDAIRFQTFANFVTDTDTQRTIKEKASLYLQHLLTTGGDEKRPWFYIGGNPGSGKSHICTAICGELLKANIGVKYMQWLEESRRLKALVNDEYFEDHVRGYIDVPVLYIDDLFKQKWSEHPTFSDADIKIAFTIINARYLMNKATIISAEWDLLNHLMDADEGVFSRVYERSRGYRLYISRNRENDFRVRG